MAIAGILVGGFVLFFHGMQLSDLLVNVVIPEYKLTHPRNEALPGLAGNWQDSQTGLVHTIAWSSESAYAVLFVLDNTYTSRRIDSQTWSKGVLTWTVAETGKTTSFTTLSLEGDRLNLSWTSTANGKTETGVRSLTRLRWDGYILPFTGE